MYLFCKSMIRKRIMISENHMGYKLGLIIFGGIKVIYWTQKSMHITAFRQVKPESQSKVSNTYVIKTKSIWV